jgi:hypothetical protein
VVEGPARPALFHDVLASPAVETTKENTMRKFLLPAVLSLAISGTALAEDAAAPAAAPAAAAADVKVGTAVEKNEIQGAAETFQVAPDTKLFTWVKVTGAADQKITVAYLKDGKEATKVELNVPRSPYRTHAYKTFRAGDSGAWTAVARTADGAEIGKASFTVEVK